MGGSMDPEAVMDDVPEKKSSSQQQFQEHELHPLICGTRHLEE
jgi:hypothetical protein